MLNQGSQISQIFLGASISQIVLESLCKEENSSGYPEHRIVLLYFWWWQDHEPALSAAESKSPMNDDPLGYSLFINSHEALHRTPTKSNKVTCLCYFFGGNRIETFLDCFAYFFIFNVYS